MQVNLKTNRIISYLNKHGRINHIICVDILDIDLSYAQKILHKLCADNRIAISGSETINAKDGRLIKVRSYILSGKKPFEPYQYDIAKHKPAPPPIPKLVGLSAYHK